MFRGTEQIACGVTLSDADRTTEYHRSGNVRICTARLGAFWTIVDAEIRRHFLTMASQASGFDDRRDLPMMT